MARILIIDDEDMVRLTLRRTLERAGYEVEEARDGREGLALLRDSPPDLVITDIIMPEKDGIETVMDLRRDGRDVKVIVMSGGGRLGNMDFLQATVKLGADLALAKPVDRNDLLEAVRACLESSAAA